MNECIKCKNIDGHYKICDNCLTKLYQLERKVNILKQNLSIAKKGLEFSKDSDNIDRIKERVESTLRLIEG